MDAPNQTVEGQIHVVGGLILSEATRQFLEHCRIGRCLSPNSLRAYEADLAGFGREVGHSTAIGNIDREMLQAFVGTLFEKRQMKATSVKRHAAVVKSLFRWLETEGQIPLTPFHRLSLPIRLPKRLPRALDSSDARLLLIRADRELRLAAKSRRHDALILQFAVTVMFTTGARISELTAIRVTCGFRSIVNAHSGPT